MIRKIDITIIKNTEDVLCLQRLSYAIEAHLIGFDEIPPLKDTVMTLHNCNEVFYGYYEKEQLSGAISFQVADGVMDIHRLMVHPDHFRKGIAKRLLNYVESNENDVETVIVSTGSKNLPAVKFYKRNGFIKTAETTVAEDLSITSFKKKV